MRKSAYFLLALVVGLFAATAALSTPAAAGAVRIQDDAKILSAADQQSITAAAQSAPFAVAVWTSSAYASQATFNSAVQKSTAQNEVTVAVDPVHKYSYIYNRGNTGLIASDTQQADQTANSQFGSGQWGAGVTAAINSLVNARASRGGGTTNTGNPAPAGPVNPLPNPAGGFNLGGCGLGLCLIPLLLIGLGAFFFFRNRGMNRNMAPGPVYPANNYPQQYPQQGYGPGPYPQQGGYYPQQGSGIGGNIASGGLGALAGGAIGYEIGKNQGEQGGNQGGGGAGPVGGGDFGSGGSFGGGDSGGGGFSSGGGQDFGGGGSFGGGDSGGGGSFGGGGDSSV